ncbi:MAG: hypothetical protein AAF573_05045 [Bacteroidota bacterium]
MFHLKLLTLDSHLTAEDIKNEIAAHPKRNFTAELNGYNFPAAQVKQLIQEKCGVCIKKTDGFSRRKIREFVELKKAPVILLAKDFSQRELIMHLENGAKSIVSLDDDFDILQIKELINKGKENTFVLGEKLQRFHIIDFLKSGSCVLLKKGDLRPAAMTSVLPFGEGRVYIQAGLFSVIRIDHFLRGKANLVISERTLLSQNAIEERVKKFTSQILIDAEQYKLDLPWINKMEQLGAIVI